MKPEHEKLIVYLDITSWKGVSFGAEHWYGKLIFQEPYEHLTVTHRMSTKQAKELNEKDMWDLYHAGSETERFDFKDEVIQSAIVLYKTERPETKILLLGDGCAVRPYKVLDGPSSIMVPCNKIYESFLKIPWIESYGFRKRDEKGYQKVDKLYRQWRKILEKELG